MFAGLQGSWLLPEEDAALLEAFAGPQEAVGLQAAAKGVLRMRLDLYAHTTPPVVAGVVQQWGLHSSGFALQSMHMVNPLQARNLRVPFQAADQARVILSHGYALPSSQAKHVNGQCDLADRPTLRDGLIPQIGSGSPSPADAAALCRLCLPGREQGEGRESQFNSLLCSLCFGVPGTGVHQWDPCVERDLLAPLHK